MMNKAALLLENRKIKIGDSDMPDLRPGYVKVKVEYCGISIPMGNRSSRMYIRLSLDMNLQERLLKWTMR